MSKNNALNIHFLANPTQRIASNKRLPTAELETLVLYGSPAVRARILKKAAANCHVLAANANTYHVVEALVRVSDPAALAELIFEVRRHVAALAQSRHGNVVLQEILRRVPAVVRNDLTEALIEQCYALATGEFGNRVIQALLVPSAAAVHLAPRSGEGGEADSSKGSSGISYSSAASFYAGDDTSCSLYNEHLSATVADKIYDVLAPRFDGLCNSEYGQAVVAAVIHNEHSKMQKLVADSNSKIADFMREQYVQQIVDAAEPNPFVAALRVSARTAQLLSSLWGSTGTIKKEEDGGDAQPADGASAAIEEVEDEDGAAATTGRMHLLCALIKASTTLFPKSAALRRFVTETAIKHTIVELHQQLEQPQPSKEAGDKQRRAVERFIAERAAVFVALCEHRPADWGVALLDAVLSLPGNRLAAWSRTQHLATIVVALLRHVCGGGAVKAEQQQKVRRCFDDAALLRELVTDRYGGVVVRQIVRSSGAAAGVVPPAAAAVIKEFVAQAGALCTQATHSLFLQALLLAPADSAAVSKAARGQIVAGVQKALQEQSPRKLINDPAASRLIECILNLEPQQQEQQGSGRAPSAFVNTVFDIVASHMQDGDDAGDEDDDDAAAAAAAAAAAGEVDDNDTAEIEMEADQKQQQKRAPLFPRFATSPNGSHVVQALLRAVSDAQLEMVALFAGSLRCRVTARFRGLPALARNKYACHVVCVLLQQLKARADAAAGSSAGGEGAPAPRMLELCRAAMNHLKPHVHFLALAASTGRRVFEVMCRTGSAELRRMMKEVVAGKCETYLRGDPFLESDDADYDGPADAGGKKKKKANKKGGAAAAAAASTFNQKTHHLEKKRKQLQQERKQRRTRSEASNTNNR